MYERTKHQKPTCFHKPVPQRPVNCLTRFLNGAISASRPQIKIDFHVIDAPEDGG